MKRARRHNHAAPPAAEAVVDKFRTQETAAGVFSKRSAPAVQPARPVRPLRPDPPVAPVPTTTARPEPLEAPSLPVSIRPLRAPAPTVTSIRVAPEPVDDFEFETATPWQHNTEVDTQPGRTPTIFVRPDTGQRILSWLDEDDA